MKDTIILKSRGEEQNTLHKLKKRGGDGSRTYLLKSSSYIIRTGHTAGGKLFIDPAGGPMIVTGEYLKEAGAVVKSIDPVIGIGYTVTFEEEKEEDNKAK